MSQAGRYLDGGTIIGAVLTITGNVGGPVPPDGGGNIDFIGGVGSHITVTGNPGTNTLTITTDGTFAEQYDTDNGSAIPSGGILNIVGGSTAPIVISNINTYADPNLSNNLFVALNNTIFWPNTNAAGSEGVLYLNGIRFLHNFGGDNTFLGQEAGNFTLSTSANTGIGRSALKSISTADSVTAVGTSALSNFSTGSGNCVAVGAGALITSVSGFLNDAIGANTGWNGALGITTGSLNVLIGGGDTGTGSAGSAYRGNESNNILIRNVGVVGENNTIRIGNAGHGRCFLAGVYNVNPTLNNERVTMIDSSGQIGTLPPQFNGQLIIGSTGTTPVVANLTAGSGISITNGAGSITISAHSGITWNEIVVTGPTQMVVDNGYIANNAGLVTLTLPAVASVGDRVRVSGKGAGGWLIAQNAGQTIFFGASTTTPGAGGSLASTQQRDSVELLCVTANNDWNVLSVIGNLTVV